MTYFFSQCHTDGKGGWSVKRPFSKDVRKQITTSYECLTKEQIEVFENEVDALIEELEIDSLIAVLEEAATKATDRQLKKKIVHRIHHLRLYFYKQIHEGF